jgi:hypothetical protein
MSSFRAEAYAFLAGVYLLCLLTLDTTDQATNEMHTDNASLLARLECALSPCMPIGFWSKPDSDTIQQIVEESQHLHELQRSYVKGHQDLTKDKKDYTLAETYSIEANHEASVTFLGYSSRPATEAFLRPLIMLL